MAKNKKATPKKTSRSIKTPKYKSFRLSKKITHPSEQPLPGILQLWRLSIRLFRSNKKLFIGILSVHFIFTIVFASGLASSIDFVNVKNNLAETFGGDIDKFSSAIALFSYVLTSGSGSEGGSSSYQIFVSLITSLATIWAIRQVMAGEKIRIRQAYYQGIYPLIPFILVLFVIGLQLVPLLIGNFLLSTVLANGLAITVAEKTLWWLIFILFALLSLYLILSSVFALYISTLPDMTPMRALRSARGLVLHRRFPVALRILGLPAVGLLIYGIILVPLIFIAPILVVPAFFALGSLSIFFIHAYLYNLYRSFL